MLPEMISNNICSLVPNKKRNVLVCEMIFNLEAQIQSYKFYEAEISSFKRFTYHEIQDYKIDSSETVSYTHLTLPTICSV